jgi:hypothetical protein
MEVMRACQAAPGWRGLRLRWCGAARLPRELIRASPWEENLATLAGFREPLAEALQGLWFRRRLQVGLPESSVRVCTVFADELPRNPAARQKYLLWRVADVADCQPERTRLAYMAFPSPLPGARYAITCALTGEQVARQYERALAESRIRYARMAPNSVLLFNLFHEELAGPPGVPTLLLAATEDTLTTVLTLEGCPIFWRSRPLLRAGEADPASGHSRRGELAKDIAEAVTYAEEQLGVDRPARVLVTGPPAEEPGLAAWLAARVGLPTACLEARHLLKRVPRHLAGEGWNHWGAAIGAAAREEREGAMRGLREPFRRIIGGRGAAPEAGRFGPVPTSMDLGSDPDLQGEGEVLFRSRKRRIHIGVLVAGLLVWAILLYWRFGSDGPAESRPAPAARAEGAAGAKPRDAARGARPSGSRQGDAGGRPELRLDLLERALPPLPSGGTNLFGPVLPPAPSAPARGAPSPAPPAPPPPDPFVQAAARLQLVALVEDEGRLLAFVASGSEIQRAGPGEILHGDFVVKDVTDKYVLLASREGQKETKLWLAPEGARPAGQAR